MRSRSAPLLGYESSRPRDGIRQQRSGGSSEFSRNLEAPPFCLDQRNKLGQQRSRVCVRSLGEWRSGRMGYGDWCIKLAPARRSGFRERVAIRLVFLEAFTMTGRMANHAQPLTTAGRRGCPRCGSTPSLPSGVEERAGEMRRSWRAMFSRDFPSPHSVAVAIGAPRGRRR